MNASVVQYDLKEMAVELREMPRPEVGEEDVLLQVGAVGVCGSDLHQAYNTHSWPVNIPVVLGHEFAGTVAAVGRRVKGFAEGDRVACETAAEICGQCVLCRQGRYNLCAKRRGFGYGVHGAMTSLVKAPARCLHRLPDSLPFEKAALTEPCCVSYHAVCVNADVKPGDTVVVLGPGPIGLLCACMAKLCGANPLIVTGLGRDAKRFESAKALGATHTINVEELDILEVVRSTGDGLGADVVIDAAGTSRTVATAIDLVRPDGRIVKVGWGPEPIGCSIDPLAQKNATLQGSFSHTYAMWEKVIHLLNAGMIPTEVIIGLKRPIEKWREAFETMHAGDVVKSILIPNSQ
jgi:alcohol dehydrogenase/L-iditol 2-dehydrogenase